MKKSLSLLLALALLLAAACIGHADERYVYTSAQYNVGPIDENPPVVQRINEKYGVEFQMVYIEDSSRGQQISLLASSNELPDIIYMPSAIDAQMLYDQGMIGTWTEEFFREHAPRISAMIDTYAPSGWSAVKFDGKMYTVPGIRYVNTIPTCIAWNADWLDKGIETCIAQPLPSASLYNTECEKILSEGYIGIITGEKPVDYFDEMVKAWYAAGGQTLTEEANAIYKAQ